MALVITFYQKRRDEHARGARALKTRSFLPTARLATDRRVLCSRLRPHPSARLRAERAKSGSNLSDSAPKAHSEAA